MKRFSAWLARKGPHLIRVGTGLISLAALGFAGYCTLESDNEVGTAATYLVGLYFAVIALTGRVPKLKMGDTELDPTSLAIGAATVSAAASQKAMETDEPEEVAAAARDAAVELLAQPRRPFGVSFMVPVRDEDILRRSSDLQWTAESRRKVADALRKTYGSESTMDEEPPSQPDPQK